MKRIKLVNLIVPDQDAAIAFFTKKLGFDLAEDLPFGEDRWVTVSLPGNPDVALALNRAKSEADKALVGRQSGSFPLLGIETLDCAADYRRLKGLGVNFDGEPQSGPWGTGVTLRDPWGNRIFLNQEPS